MMIIPFWVFDAAIVVGVAVGKGLSSLVTFVEAGYYAVKVVENGFENSVNWNQLGTPNTIFTEAFCPKKVLYRTIFKINRNNKLR